MKSVKQLAFAALLSLGALGAVTMVSCNKEDDPIICDVGYTGDDCNTMVIASYTGQYKGSGTDNNGETYTNWSLTMAPSSTTDVTKMTMILSNENGQPIRTLGITLKTNTSFDVDNFTTSDNYTYSGTGTINATTISLTLNERDNEANPPTTVVYTFNNMTK